MDRRRTGAEADPSGGRRGGAPADLWGAVLEDPWKDRYGERINIFVASGGPLSCFGKKEAKEAELRGANVALPRVKYALLRISRGALTIMRNSAFEQPGRAEIGTFPPE